jgi:mono/diheme cytochrome c family protein
MMTAAFLLTLLAAAPQASHAAPVPRAKAVEIYASMCQICHGPEGKGTPLIKGLEFTGRKWKHGSGQAEVIKTISNGIPSTQMHPFKDRLTPQEIAALAALARSYDKALKPGPARRGTSR